MNNGRSRILIVDDEATNIQLLESALRKDYEVHAALNGYDALGKVKECLPDLILLDVMMPELNGFDVSRLIKSDEMFSAIPIIFLTAMDTVEAEAEGLEAGGIDYLTKPVELNLLKLRVRNHLESKRRSDLIRTQRDHLARQKEELEAAMARIKRLEGLISICMHCKNIRSEDTAWQRIEQYFAEHTDALFSHCICPSCLKQHYPDLLKEKPS